jgi:hypothetical protein
MIKRFIDYIKYRISIIRRKREIKKEDPYIYK